MLPEVKKVARDAFTKEILFNILSDIEQRYKKEHGENYQLKIAFEMLNPQDCSEVEQLKLYSVEPNSDLVILHTKSYSFEIFVPNPIILARLLVREYNVYSCIETIQNPDSRLWLSGIFLLIFEISFIK